MTAGTDLSFFERMANCLKRSQMDTSGIFQQPNRAFIEAFYHVLLTIAKAKLPHTIPEELILPCANEVSWSVCSAAGRVHGCFICAPLTAFVSYIYNGEFKHEFLCIINLLSRIRGEDIYQTIHTFSRQFANRCADFAQILLWPYYVIAQAFMCML